MELHVITTSLEFFRRFNLSLEFIPSDHVVSAYIDNVFYGLCVSYASSASFMFLFL